MPELPEVETSCRGISPLISNRTVSDVLIHNASLRWPVPADLKARIKGQTVSRIFRRAKYILIQLGTGPEQSHLLIHLGMSGSLSVVSKETPLKKHDHVEILFGNHALRLNDPRRFGAVLCSIEPIEQHHLFQHLGPEPMTEEFNSEYLLNRLKNKHRQPIKNAIMDARIVVGVGNIYANEALFNAGVFPLLPASQLNKQQADQLVNCIKNVLHKAIEQGGTTLKDFKAPDGKPGYFSQDLNIYGRKGLPCIRCGVKILEVRLQGRSTVYCPDCQPEALKN